MGFPFDSQGPGSSRNVLLHFFCIIKQLKTETRLALGLVGRMTYLDLTLNIKLAFWTDNAKTRNFVLGPTKYESLKSTIARKCS